VKDDKNDDNDDVKDDGKDDKDDGKGDKYNVKKQKALLDMVLKRAESTTASSDDDAKMCSRCGKHFSSRQARWRHEKRVRCKQKAQPIIKRSEIKQQLEALLEELGLGKVTQPKQKGGGDSGITYNITQNTYNIVQINSFGQEDTSYITPDYLQDLLQKPAHAVPALIKHIHFNPDHPENRNVKITSRKARFAEVFANCQWKVAHKKEVLDALVNKGFTLLDSCYEDNGKGALMPKHKEKYIEFQEKMDDLESRTRRKVTSDAEIVVLNNSNND
jgi:hypothetical protein